MKTLFQTAILLAALVVAAPALQSAVLGEVTLLPSLPANGSGRSAASSSWASLPDWRQSEFIAQVEGRLHDLGPPFVSEWVNQTGATPDIIPSLVPGLYDSVVAAQEALPVQPTQAEAVQAFWNVAFGFAEQVGMPPLEGELTLPSPDLDEHTARCHSNPAPLVVLCFIWIPVVVAVLVVALVCAVACPTVMSAADVDKGQDGMGDDFQKAWGDIQGALNDADGDGLDNVQEFRWNLVPVCTALAMNCADHERSPTTGVGGDGWLDGPEVAYWNDPSNDAALDASKTGFVALADSDRLLDSDGDGLRNLDDTDSDNDGLLDGFEIQAMAYPEFPDSDCPANALQCTPSSQSSYFDADRQGNPGAGDGLNDKMEFDAWNALGPGKRTTDFDGDGISSNLLDPDSDDDGLLDGPEFLLGKGQVRPDLPDTDLDGVLDADELAWSEDTDLDGKVNANDQDSDNDGMPDKWEVDHHFNMVDPSDALADRDGDLLNNLGEYLAATNPDDMDSEGTELHQGDLLLDGEEVNIYHTDPHHWDTDRDGMADRFETLHGLDPTNPGDAGLDSDGDSFDLGNDGTIDQPWTNLDEYRSGRPATHDEELSGPWMAGTNPKDIDTDKDTALDGYEAYYRTNPNVPADVASDEDEDGLTWTQESEAGTDPQAADTDGDGLCDGGRAAACKFPGGSPGNLGYQPGEATYGSIPWTTDSDSDGIPDGIEAWFWDPSATGEDRDIDGDFVGGVVDADSDEDGLNDGEEAYMYGTPRDDPDADKDRLSDGDEVLLHATNPRVKDTDQDRLDDGDEVAVHHTQPSVRDTDRDQLDDGTEILEAGTDPLSSDSDRDSLPDGWEHLWGTLPRTPDAEQDPDADSLAHAFEYVIGTNPMAADTDGDTMPDNYEHVEGLDPTSAADKTWDNDADGLTNLQEFGKGTRPGVADTDGDNILDGPEIATYGTDPLNPDSDLDGIRDGSERWYWGAWGASWSTNYDGDPITNNLLDPDSDNDGLRDGEEFLKTRSKPHMIDTDGDTVSDFDEVVTFRGRFDPTKKDSDGDGYDDGVEAEILLDTGGDFDHDGMSNGAEEDYSTDPTAPDTDCDGIEDGPESTFWGPDWATGGNRLLVADVDGDTIKDGIEVGTVGTPSEILYLTDPAAWDTDTDGLGDHQEGRNTVRVSCNQPQGAATSRLPVPTPGPSLQDALASLDALQPGLLYEGPEGVRYGVDSEGIYIQGGYGVQLYVERPHVDQQDIDAPEAVVPDLWMTAAGPSGYATNPTLPDTDGDGLNDHEELSGTANPYKGQSSIPGQAAGNTNPVVCDSDGDGLGDGLELGRTYRGSYAPRSGTAPACQQRDIGPYRSNPNSQDTDGDRRLDGPANSGCGASGASGEDRNCNGLADGLMPWNYCSPGAESEAGDGDSDDDGLPDASDIAATCFDYDYDGLSDGLELGTKTPASGTFTGNYVNAGGRSWPTWQPYQGFGVTTNPRNPDSDGDGIIDGLEDANHNGIFGDAGELNANGPDTDGDGITDGKELLVYGSYTFPTVMSAWGGSFAQMQFDPNNPFETNPRDATTDTDTVVDGKDIQPRGDGLLNFGFRAYRSVNRIDPNAGPFCNDCGYKVDLKMSISVDTPAGQYAFNTLEIENWYTKDEQSFNNLPAGETLKLAEEQAKPASVAGKLYAVGQSVPLDLPENTDNLVRRDPRIALALGAIDDDYGDDGVDDVIDISPEPGTGLFKQTLDLTGGPMKGTVTPWRIDNANGAVDGQGSDNGHLRVSIGSTLVPYFLRDALRGGPITAPQGLTCLGDASCIG